MFILQKKNSLFVLLIFILSGCHVFFPLEPVASVNDNFMSSYGNIVNKAKKRNQESIKNSNYNGTVSLEKTAYGRQIQNERDFLKNNTANNPYVVDEKASAENVEYLTYNYGPYFEKEQGMFDDIKTPSNDFKYYYLGDKDYNDINNIELQQTYDYMEVMSKERTKQIELARLKEEVITKQENKNKGIFEKTKSGLKNLTDRIKGLLD